MSGVDLDAARAYCAERTTGAYSAAVVTAPSPELVGALAEVTRLLDDTVRDVRMEHGAVVFVMEHHVAICHPHTATFSLVGRDPIGADSIRYWEADPTDAQRDALGALAIEVHEWHLEVLADAVQATDWTGNRKGAEP